QREPERLRGKSGGPLGLTRPRSPRHDRRCPVGEEVEDRERPCQNASGKAERSELRAAEVADDRGVDEDVERLCGQRAESRQREPQDLAIMRGAKAHGAPTIMARMKIGIVVPYSWSFWGGVVEHAELQADALKKLGHEVK